MNKSDQDQNAAARIEQLKSYLDCAGIAYEILVHDQNLTSAEDGVENGLGSLSSMAPTFILRTESGYLAAVIRGDTRLSYKKIKRKFGLKDVSLASPEEVKAVTGSEVGYVALVNHGLSAIFDEHLLEVNRVYGGSGVPNHTLRINPRDVAGLTKAEIFDFTELKS